MNKGLIRTAAVILSGTILAACAGCSSGKNSSSSSRNNMVSATIPEGANVAAEDMPYGASVTQLKPATDSNNDVQHARAIILTDSFFIKSSPLYPLSVSSFIP